MLKDIGVDVIGGLLILAIAAVAVAVWARRGRPRQWLKNQEESAKESERQTDNHTLATLREQVAELARLRGDVIPIRTQGSNPTVVTFSDGQASWYYSDFAAYKRAMNSGTASPTRTFGHAFKATPVSRWSKAELEKWLSEHAV